MPQKLTDAERTRRAVEHARISSEDHARALAEDSGLVPYEAHEQARQAARARISAAVVRPVKGRARPREEALREYDQEMGRRRDRITERYGPTSSVLWQFWAPDADDESPVRWRLELECGHVTEALTNSESQLPLGPWPTNSGDALIEGECFCPDRECSWRQPGARYYDRTWPEQDVAVWGARAPDFFLKPDPVEPPDYMAGLKPDLWAKVRHAETRTFSQWHVTLACGHTGMISAPHDWKPEDGITRRPAPDPDPKREERRQEILAGLFGEDLRHDATEGYPEPKPWKECLLCAIGRRIVAYEYVGALGDRPPWKPAKPPTPAERKSALQRQLDDADRKAKAAERKAAKLRQELAQLGDAGG